MRPDRSGWRLFGYGSLIATPEIPDRVLGRNLAHLSGWRRSFNKRSPGRGCSKRDAYDAFDAVPEAFRQVEWNPSLAVGTAADPHGEIAGVALKYAAADEAAVLAETDVREGYDASADVARLGYLRQRVSIRVDGKTADAWTYLSNPGGSYHLDPAHSLADRAQILINATPRPGTPSFQDGHARGLGYLEQLRDGLLALDVLDPVLEDMAAAVHAIAGPWRQHVRPACHR